ncbi:type I-E CRISPR-associated protein Cas5/CasD [Rothia terrae]|uniref:type I-E CRISPR-associated protein Cas5/CasD n=1 Tax=Rothia terrae TaxID=396015 RepID=UPI002880FEE5|nr:type I-E CRISPR-associated protein Cas5/CasD [Rothia terrae]MDT0189633.1 type I-E CRISPR-associated protein Cas5/CasD [Rothia terrae]
MYSLLLKFKAPLQAWGAESRYKTRSTNNEPTKSGVIGLLAAALGRSREEPIDDLIQLTFAVRTDHLGTLLRDYHTARDWFDSREKNSQLSTRYYLSDAVFLVALSSPDKSKLEEIEAALRRPIYPLYLGRRSCPANPDLVMGIVNDNGEKALRETEWLAPEWIKKQQPQEVLLPISRDAQPGEPSDTLRDIPVSFNPAHRQYNMRSVYRAEPLTVQNPAGRQSTDIDFMKEVREA